MTDTKHDDGGPAHPSDTEMMDWLESRRTNYGLGIIFRYSTTGRGWRLHETSDDWPQYGHTAKPQPSVRDALAAAMIAEKRRRERSPADYPEVADAKVRLRPEWEKLFEDWFGRIMAQGE